MKERCFKVLAVSCFILACVFITGCQSAPVPSEIQETEPVQPAETELQIPDTSTLLMPVKKETCYVEFSVVPYDVLIATQEMIQGYGENINFENILEIKTFLYENSDLSELSLSESGVPLEDIRTMLMSKGMDEETVDIELNFARKMGGDFTFFLYTENGDYIVWMYFEMEK